MGTLLVITPSEVSASEWSIGIYEGDRPLTVAPMPGTPSPVLTAQHVTDVPATFVADPFMLRTGTGWYLFFEILNGLTGQGDIGLATSADGLAWDYRQIVLDEAFHLSYPHVFEWQGGYYMMPETNQTSSVMLYRAVDFPLRWQWAATLVSGRRYVDPTIFRYGDVWWLFAGRRQNDNLYLFYADNLTGPWVEHPRSPVVVGDLNIARPGGRVLQFDGRLVRIAQDDDPTYGNQVRAFDITTLTKTAYAEREAAESPLFGASGVGWNSEGMHQLDALLLPSGRWRAAVDGLGNALPWPNQPPEIDPPGSWTVRANEPLSVPVTARDADGPAPLNLTATGVPPGAVFTDVGNGNGIFSWTPRFTDVSPTPYAVTVKATDGAGMSSSAVLRTTVVSAAAGSLTGSVTLPMDTVDLTAEGTQDWVHVGLDDATSVNRKAGVVPRIGPVLGLGRTPYRFTSGTRPAYDWSDGTPTAATTTRAGLWVGGLGNGFEVTLPADTSLRTAVVYLGGYRGEGRLQATLSDGSAAPYEVTVKDLTTAFDRRVAIDYQAGTPGSVLTLRYTLSANAGGGNVTFQAVTMRGPTVNEPPTLDPPGDWTIRALEDLVVPVRARDTDGPAPLTLTAAGAPPGAVFTDFGNGNGEFRWTPQLGQVSATPYAITVTARDGAGLTTSAPLNVTVVADGSGSLVGTVSVPTGTADLTAEGPLDWMHVGLVDATSVNRKAGLTSQIGPVLGIGRAPYRFASSSRLEYAWTDGTPTPAATTRAGLWVDGIGHGFEATLPADGNLRRAVVYLGGYKSSGRLEATLNDGSASPYVVSVSDLTAAYDRRVVLDYRAATPGASLTLRYTMTTSTGNVTFQAIALGGPAVNQPPEIDPPGTWSVKAFEPLSVPVTARDLDGPAPLTLTAAGVPPGAVFTDFGNGAGELSWTPGLGDVSATPYSIAVTATDGAGLSSSGALRVTVVADENAYVTGTVTTPTGIAALTTEGTLDWLHVGLTDATSVNRKTGVASQIGSIRGIGRTPYRFTSRSRLGYSWTDGTPTLAATTRSGLWVDGVGNGFEILLPADQIPRRAVVYLGGYYATGRLEATLNDGSAAPWVTTVSDLAGSFDRRVTIDYRAGTPGSTLTLRYTLVAKAGGANVTVQAVAVRPAP